MLLEQGWQNFALEASPSVSEFGILSRDRITFAYLKTLHSNEHERFRGLLRKARVQAGLTQTDLASRLGVPQSFVSKYESGERRLDVLELRLVCQAVGVSLQEFVRQLEKGIR
jgi:ribosome-binding protein aMBF1 (putative translation factor)